MDNKETAIEMFESVINDNIVAEAYSHNGSGSRTNAELMDFTGQEALDLLDNLANFKINVFFLDKDAAEAYEKASLLHLINGEGFADYKYDCVQIDTKDAVYEFYVPRGGW